ncbi:PIG-L deacetylase family protein [Candidatus Marithrix sp. Canyon 246]|uniref:PIG-L deacetylase family protein n=1 Tax=Candidatus Marithrix sp. Canyon 246 TaxID=1827136 RepID=UPI00084A1574|nr:PIG-L deacetylase family protein [Candidatus Marithrix sp. Canyon 246]
MKNKIAIIAAHPDDEILGCGATMAKHIQAGDEVSVLIMAEGITSRDQQRNRNARSEELSELAETAIAANKILGVTSVTLKNFPDNRMDSIDRLDIIKTIENFIEKQQPDIIYTHYNNDLNIDHRRINEAVVTACRPQPGSTVKSLLFFEVASSTEWQIPNTFSPNWFVDVSETLNLKLKALEAYQSEMRPYPHARSIQAVEHLARWRGASVGVEAAEGFVLGRTLINKI